MPKPYEHLGVYSDLAHTAKRVNHLFPKPKAGRALQKRLFEAVGFNPGPAKPKQVRVERAWERDGVAGEFITWSVGYGPRTEAWLLRPAGVKGKLPGVLALHDHGGFKFFGKEKIADGPDGPAFDMPNRMTRVYGGRPFANELARRGFAVLAFDVYLFGSRKVPYEQIPDRFRDLGERLINAEAAPEKPLHQNVYNRVAGLHETWVGYYARLLGTTIGGIACYEDRVAAAYLASRKDVQPGGIGCVGLSGGGFRSGSLNGTCTDIRAAVVVAAMCSMEGLLNRHVVCHGTDWFPNAWSSIGDWPDIASARAPSPLMVMYNSDDPLFSTDGMRAANHRLKAIYRSARKPTHYTGRFYPGPHKFDAQMQDDAFAWLGQQLNA